MAEGDGSSRNFRSAYYEKLGFCGNEEKNILDLLIASSPFDLGKLGDLCDRFDLDRRCVEAWKVLLGVECGRKNPFDETSNIRRVRAEHFQSLKHHLEVLLKHNLVIRGRLKTSSRTRHLSPVDNQGSDAFNCQSSNNCGNLKEFIDKESQNDRSNKDLNYSIATSSEELNNSLNEPENIMGSINSNPGKMITLMYLLEAGRLDTSDIERQLDSEQSRKLLAMASFFANISKDLQEAFFIFRNFTRKLEMNENAKISGLGNSNKERTDY